MNSLTTSFNGVSFWSYLNRYGTNNYMKKSSTGKILYWYNDDSSTTAQQWANNSGEIYYFLGVS